LKARRNHPATQPEYDEVLGSWATNFIMAPINTKNVHRTNALLGHAFGKDLVYDEMMLTGPGEAGQQAAEYVAKTPMIGTANDPQPGEGPTKEERDKRLLRRAVCRRISRWAACALFGEGRQGPGLWLDHPR
jgi:short subunit dehydrogenase-like uncharacterized protein